MADLTGHTLGQYAILELIGRSNGLVMGVILVAVVVGLGGCQAATTPEAAQPTVTREPTEFVPTNTPTATPTDTPMPTETPIPLGFSGHPVTRNNQWTPVIQEFEGVEMALVPAGCFMMGSEEGDDDERPVHEVCFEEPFWIDVYEVTNARFAVFLNELGNQTEGGATWLDAGDENALIHQSGGKWVPLSDYDAHPVVEVTWYGATSYCGWRGARLPTEAEWEYAARGPDGLVYPWGNDFVADNVVYDGNSGDRTWAVGSKPGGVSWIGAFDLSGNVWEWGSDWYADHYRSGQQVNPTGPGAGVWRVSRGGSWGNKSYHVRANYRYAYVPDITGAVVGFRCACIYSP